MTAPVYKIENSENYDVKVSISGFENKMQDYPLMDLCDSAAAVQNENDLYLAVKGLDGSSTGVVHARAKYLLR